MQCAQQSHPNAVKQRGRRAGRAFAGLRGGGVEGDVRCQQRELFVDVSRAPPPDEGPTCSRNFPIHSRGTRLAHLKTARGSFLTTSRCNSSTMRSFASRNTLAAEAGSSRAAGSMPLARTKEMTLNGAQSLAASESSSPETRAYAVPIGSYVPTNPRMFVISCLTSAVRGWKYPKLRSLRASVSSASRPACCRSRSPARPSEVAYIRTYAALSVST